MLTRIKVWFRNKWNTIRRQPATRVALAVSVAAIMGFAVYFAIVSAFALLASVAKTAIVLGIVTTVLFTALFVSRLKGNLEERPTFHGGLSILSRGFAAVTVFLLMIPLIFPMSVIIAAWEMSKVLTFAVLIA